MNKNKKYWSSMMAIFAALAVLFGGLTIAGTTAAEAAAPADVVSVTSSSTSVSGVNWRGEAVWWWKMRVSNRQIKKMKRRGKCFTTDGWNYYNTSRGKGRKWDRRMKVCRSKKSPTGYIKVGGGRTGSNCKNPVVPKGKRPMRARKLGRITEFRSKGRILAQVSAFAKSAVSASRVCPNGARLSGSASGYASASARMEWRFFVKARGRGNRFESGLRASLKGSATAAAVSNVTINCGTAGPTPPPSPSAVTIYGSPAHMIVGGSSQIYAEVNKTNAAISFTSSGVGWVAGSVPVSTRWNGSPCPSTSSCWRTTAWAGATPGTMTVTASSAGATPKSVSFPVVADTGF